MKKVKNRYRRVIREGDVLFSDNPYEFAGNICEMAKKLLVKDGYHASILWYRANGQEWKLVQAIFEDQLSKYIFWNQFAKQIEKEKIDAIVFVSEIWVGTFEKLVNKGQRASQQVDRKEALTVDIFVKGQKGESHITMFERDFLGKIILKETIREDKEENSVGYIQPVLDVWKRQM